MARVLRLFATLVVTTSLVFASSTNATISFYYTEKEDVVHGAVAFSIYRRRNRELSRRFDRQVEGEIIQWTVHVEREKSTGRWGKLKVRAVETRNSIHRRRFSVRYRPNFRHEFRTDIYMQTKI
mgnify:CR=1 FL=1